MAEHVTSRIETGRRDRTRHAALRSLQVTASCSVAVLAWQFITAGALFPHGGPGELHAAGAVVLHVVTGLAAIAALAHQRVRRGRAWPPTVAGAVFAVSFVQAYFGGHQTLAVHVPGAFVLTIGAVWLAAWALTRDAARAG